MRIGRYHWMMAFSSAVLMHVIVMAGLLWQPNIRWTESTESTEPAGIEISLGSAVAQPGSVAGTITRILEAERVVATETALQGPSEKTVTMSPAPVPALAVEPVVPEMVKPAEVEAARAETAGTAVEIGSVAPQPVEQASPAELVEATSPGPTLAPRLAEEAGAPPRDPLEVEAVTPAATTLVEAARAETAATAVEIGSVAPQPVEQASPAELVEATSPGPTLAPRLAEEAGAPPRDPLEVEAVTPAAATLVEAARTETAATAVEIGSVAPQPVEQASPAELVEATSPGPTLAPRLAEEAGAPPRDPLEVEAVTPAAATLVEAARAETAATAVEIGSVAPQPVEQASPAELVEATSPEPTLAPRLAEEAGAPPRDPLEVEAVTPAAATLVEAARAETVATAVEIESVAVPGALGRSGAGAGPSSIGDGGMAGARADYMARLQAWLEKYKEYPRRARSRRQEGTVYLYFVIDRDGRLRDYRIKRSSGYDLLDRAAIAMIKRAQPLPRIPDSLDRTQVVLVVPVQFVLR